MFYWDSVYAHGAEELRWAVGNEHWGDERFWTRVKVTVHEALLIMMAHLNS